MAQELATAFRLLAAALERLHISYAIGGSIASSARSIARLTQDVDLVARIGTNQADRLARELGSLWYADAEQMRAAIQAGRSFNLIYLPMSYKMDIFPATEEFHQIQLERATRVALEVFENEAYPVTSAEDILLAKLRWYRMGGEVSERQWTDITNILAINQNLDFEYLNLWAAKLEVTDLLEKARVDADI